MGAKISKPYVFTIKKTYYLCNKFLQINIDKLWFCFFCSNNNAIKEMWRRNDTDSTAPHEFPWRLFREYRVILSSYLQQRYLLRAANLEPPNKTSNKYLWSSFLFLLF